MKPIAVISCYAKNIRKEKKFAESKRLFHQNQAEEARLRLNVELFNKRIENLKMPIKKVRLKNNQSKFRTAQSQNLFKDKSQVWKKKANNQAVAISLSEREKEKSLKDIHKMATEKDY